MAKTFRVNYKSLCLAVIFYSLAIVLSSCAGQQKEIRRLSSEDYYRQAQQDIAQGKYKEAKEKLQEARKSYRSGELDAHLLATLGDVHYQLKEYLEAQEVYGEFLNLHPRNRLAPEVQYQLGMSCFQMVRPKDRDPEPTRKALDAFEKLIENYPRSSQAQKAEQRITACRNVLSERELFVGKFYFKKKNYLGAIGRFEAVISDYHDTSYEEEALYYLGEAYRRMEDEDKAQGYFLLLLERYPGSKYFDDVRDFLDERRG